MSRTPASVIDPPDEVDVEEVRGLDPHVGPLAIDLVEALAEHAVELGHCDGDEVGVCDPRTVEAVPGFALLVVAHLGQRLLGDGRDRGDWE